MRIVLADDHPLIRRGLRALLGREPGAEIVGEAADGEAALAEVARLRPDVLIVDINMPAPGGLRVVSEVRRRFPEVAAVVLTMYEDDAFVRAAFAAGARGYVVKRCVDEDLIAAVRAVCAGRRYVCEAVRSALDEDPVSLREDESAALSARERQVLELVALGHTSDEISKRLKVGTKSIESYRARLKSKLGLSSRADIVRYALELGVIHSGDVDADTPATPTPAPAK